MDIKICGLKTGEAIDAALDGGASHVGFIFFPKSPRNVDPAEAGRLREAARGKAKVVAVTVDAGDAALDAIVEAMSPYVLQLHGHESPARVAEIRKRYGLPVMKALAIREAADLQAVKPYLGVADRFLLDAKPPAGSELPGGNGVSFDWSLRAARHANAHTMLPGGPKPKNSGAPRRTPNPPGLDVSSGVESAPGVKDERLIAEFFRAVRSGQDRSAA